MKRGNASMGRPPAVRKKGSNPHGRLILPGLLMAIFSFAGAGCATKPIEVKIPVSVSCVGVVPERPGTTFGADKWPGGKAAAQAALIDASLWKGYALGLETVVAGCR